MPKVKNVSGQDRTLPPSLLGGRLVTKGAVIEVEAEQVYGLTCQAPNWEAVDASAKRAHTDGHADELALQDPTPAPEATAETEESD